MQGWGKTKAVAEYAGVCPKTFRVWLQRGLKHTRLPSGTILIRYADVDEFLERFSTDQGERTQGIVDDILKAVS